MKKYLPVFLLSLMIFNPISVFGLFDKAPADVKDAKAEIQQYMTSNNESILKSYNGSGWDNWNGDDKSNVYVISHGLNDKHDADWINKTATAIKKADSGATILSVNWDKFSGTKEEKNFLASTWISATSELVTEALNGAKIKQAVGHSYGAHLLASVISTTTAKVDNFVALDPAEESGTLVARNSIWNSTALKDFWKKARAKTTVEVYKSSVICGTEIPLGHNNFLLASPSQISPKSLGGDWTGGGLNNHSLAKNWYADMVTAKGTFSGWYTKEVNADVTTTVNGKTQKESASVGEGNWTGVVNTAKTDKLDYLLPKSKATGNWGEVFTHMGLDTADWNGTVLDPAHKKNFDSQFAVQTYKDADGNTWTYDPKTGETTCNGQKVNSNSTLGNNWNSTGGGTGNTNSLTDVLDQIMTDLETGGKDVFDDALDIFKQTWKNSTGSIWDRLKTSVTGGVQGGINSLKANAKILISKYISWNTLESVANWGLNKLLSMNPTLKNIFDTLGLNNIGNLIGTCKDLFNLVKGLLTGGSFLSLLQSSAFLKNVLNNALALGVGLLKNLLSNLLTSWLDGLVKWVENFVQNALGKFGIKVSINLQNLLQKGIDAALNSGTKWVKAKVDSFLNPNSNSPPAPAPSNPGGTTKFKISIPSCP